MHKHIFLSRTHGVVATAGKHPIVTVPIYSPTLAPTRSKIFHNVSYIKAAFGHLSTFSKKRKKKKKREKRRKERMPKSQKQPGES